MMDNISPGWQIILIAVGVILGLGSSLITLAVSHSLQQKTTSKERLLQAYIDWVAAFSTDCRQDSPPADP